jgi:hypothetical protein
MAPSHLNSYPKVFNPFGNLKAFPLRRPVVLGSFWSYCWTTMAIAFIFEGYREWTFEKYTKGDFFKKDVSSLSFRKLNYS